jgi:hypothetical protein
MQFHINYRRSHLITLEMEANAKVSEVKQRLESTRTYKAKDSKLFYAGKDLEDHRSLAYYLIKSNDTLILVVKFEEIELSVKYCREIHRVKMYEQDQIADLKRHLATILNLKLDTLRLIRRGITLSDTEPLKGIHSTLSLLSFELYSQVGVLGPGSTIITVDWGPSSTISDIRRKLLGRDNFPLSAFCLLHQGRVLREGSLVGECKIGQKTVLIANEIFEGDIKVRVDWQDITIPVSNIDPISLIKAKIAHFQGTPAETQRLLYKSKDLQDDKSLLEYGISLGSTLKLLYLRQSFPLTVIREDSPSITIQASGEDSVVDVKAMIRSQEGILIDSQTLVFDGRLLEDLETMDSARVTAGCSVYLIETSSWINVLHKNDKFTLSCPLTATVSHLKTLIKAKRGFDPSFQDLYIEGRYLSDGLLSVRGVHVGSTVQLKVELFRIYLQFFFTDKQVSEKVKLTDTVHDLKARIAISMKKPVGNIELYFNKKKLRNDQTIGDANIVADSILNLIIDLNE